MATRQILRERVERKLYMRRRPTAGGTEALVGNVFSIEKINDALNDALAWMDVALIDMKDGRAWFNFATQNLATVYSVPSGTKKPILGVVYNYDVTPIYCKRIVILNTEDRASLSSGSFFQPSANQSFFADMESIGVDGLELFISGGITNALNVKFWANVEFNRMTSDSDDLSLGERLEKLMVDFATAVCERDVPGGVFTGQSNLLFESCAKLAEMYNSWRT